MRLHKSFANNSSANIKLSKTHLHKIGESGGFLGRLLQPLLKTGLPLVENLFKTLVKSVSPLRLTAAASATAIHQKMFGSGMHTSDLAKRTTLIFSNEKLNDMKIVSSLEKAGWLIKGMSKIIKMKQKNKKEGFLECC